MFSRLQKSFNGLRAQLMASVFLWISPALVLTFIINQDWFWRYSPEWLRYYAVNVPWESFGVGVLALIAAWYGGEHFILRQIRALMHAVQQLAHGNLKARTGLQEAQGEIGQLAVKFDEMVETLHQRQKERDEADRKLLNRAMQQTAVAAMGQCALTNRDLDVIYEQAVYRAAEIFALEYAMLYQRLPDGTLHPIHAYGHPPRPTGDLPHATTKPGQMPWTADTGEVSVVNDWRIEDRFSMSPLLIELGVASGVAVAIPTRNKPFGVLAVHTTQRRDFSPDDIQFLIAIANTVGMATERIRAEAQSEKLAAFVKENPNATMELAPDGSVNYFNDAAEKLARSLGHPHPGKILPEHHEAIVAGCLTDGNRQEGVLARVNDHTICWAFQPLADAGVVHCHGEDITLRLNLESQLLQSEKMKTFGQFAAGIAHDFNNMLTIIQGHSSKLLAMGSFSTEFRESLSQIHSAGDRASRLTRQLLLTSRKNVMQPRLLDLQEVVGNTSQMLERLVGETIRIRFHCASSLPHVHADQSMVEQVVMNLASNARDAMPDGGELHIRISETHVSMERRKICPDALPGKYVNLEVIDTGCGMDEQTRLRVFEPFFTTKDIGKGTGLGLATVFNIARQHNGWVEVESQPGKGSTFRVFFPASDEYAPPPRSCDNDPATFHATGGNETILIVEDEDMLRQLARDILRDCGYQTLEARSGRQALELWQQNIGKVDLLLTDMVMPEGVSGVELAERLVTLAPELKVVYMSGYTADEVNSDLLERTNASFIQKPYSHMELVSIVRKSLTGQDPGKGRQEN